MEMTEQARPTAPKGFGAGLVVLATIMCLSFAASFMHVHQWFQEHGQDGWVSWTDAVVVELLFLGSTLEIARRLKSGHPLRDCLWPALCLILGVAMTMVCNLSTRDDPGMDYLVAAGFAPLATMLIMAVFKSALTARLVRLAEEARVRAQEEARRADTERAASRTPRPRRRPADRTRAIGHEGGGDRTLASSADRTHVLSAAEADVSGHDRQPVADNDPVVADNVAADPARGNVVNISATRGLRLPESVLDDLLSGSPTKTQAERANEFNTTERTIRRLVNKARAERQNSAEESTGEVGR